MRRRFKVNVIRKLTKGERETITLEKATEYLNELFYNVFCDGTVYLAEYEIEKIRAVFMDEKKQKIRRLHCTLEIEGKDEDTVWEILENFKKYGSYDSLQEVY